MTMQRRLAMGGGEWTLLLALSALWGSSFFFFKVLVTAIPPLTVVLGRVGFAALALNLVLTIRRQPMRRDMPWGSFATMGLLNNIIPFFLIAWGETRISSGLASILNATTPIFAVLAAHFLTRDERLTWPRIVGVLCGFAGVGVLMGGDALRGIASEDMVGKGACLLAAISYACAGLYGRRFRLLPPLMVATGQITASTALLLPVAALADRFWSLPMPSLVVWESFAGIAVLCTALAYMLYFRLLAAAGTTNLLLVTFLLPISALLLGHFILGEQISSRAYPGMALIALGLGAIDGRVLGWFRAGTVAP